MVLILVVANRCIPTVTTRLIFHASRTRADLVRPVTMVTRWHSSYGMSICPLARATPVTQVSGEVFGIYSRRDSRHRTQSRGPLGSQLFKLSSIKSHFL
jgi:hypothetical protein